MTNGPLFETSSLGFYLKVYADRIEFKDAKGKHTVFIHQITSVSLPFLGGRSIDIETTGGEKYNIIAKKKKDAFEAIKQARDSCRRQDGKKMASIADELKKLVTLRDNGILTSGEYEDQKKKLLS